MPFQPLHFNKTMSNNTDSDRDPPSTDEGNVKLGFYIASLILGFGGNSLVITVMSRKKQKRSIPRLFILNLAISDLSFIMIATPVTIYTYIGKIYQNSYYCRLLTPLLTIFYFVSIFTIFSMAVHRCRLITNPYRPKMRMRNAYIWIAAIWFSSLIIVLPLSVVSETNNGICYENWPSINHRKAYTIALCILQFVMPLLIIGVAYARIGIYLRRSANPQSSLPALKRRKENIQVIKTLAMIVILFVICLLPGQTVVNLADILDILHSCLNPIVYGLSNKRFRRECIQHFFDCFTCGSK